jgi:uncharacterized protein (DUF2236 family)
MSRLDRTVATMTESGAAKPAKELVSLADTTFSTGLIERSAAAFASGVPAGAGDDGFFGPGSVTWRVSADLASPVAGLRSLLMQALHPLAMAGVDRHSGWRQDPVGRLAATSAYLATVTFGDQAAALHAAARVRRIHDHVRGTDAVTGRPYAAGDPALLLWVHAALVAAESMAYLLDPPGLDEDIAEIWQDIRDAAIAVLPRWARQMYGYSAPPLPPGRRTEIRQSLGVLDAIFLGEPGVLEARQRITLRMRAGRPA